MPGNYRYEEERYGGGPRGSSRFGDYGERARDDDDFEQQQRERFRGSEFGRDYGERERWRGRSEGSWRSRERDSGRSLGGRDDDRYDDEENSGSSYSDGGREGNRYGRQYGNLGRAAGQRYDQRQGMRDYNPSQGFGYAPDYRPIARGQGSAGYSSSGDYGPQSYDQPYQGYGRGSSYDEGTPRGQSWRRSPSWQDGPWYGQGGQGGLQADGWSGEPDEMRWGRQQGLYGSSEYAGHISSQRSQRAYQSHVGKGPKGWQRSDDRIRDEVNETLARHPDIDASEIEVRVQNGEVMLSGTVDERRDKRTAEDIVERVFGVRDVENKIKVKGGLFGFFGDKSDKDVTGKAEREIEEGSRRTTPGSTLGATSGSTAR